MTKNINDFNVYAGVDLPSVKLPGWDVDGATPDVHVTVQMIIDEITGGQTFSNFNLDTGEVLTIGGEQVLAAPISGWGDPTGTATRTTFATASVTLEQLAERVMAIILDLKSHGQFKT